VPDPLDSRRGANQDPPQPNLLDQPAAAAHHPPPQPPDEAHKCFLRERPSACRGRLEPAGARLRPDASVCDLVSARLLLSSRQRGPGYRNGDDAMTRARMLVPLRCQASPATVALLVTGLPVTLLAPLSCWHGSRSATLVRLRSIRSPSRWYPSCAASASQKRCRVWLKPPLVKARIFAGRTANTSTVPEPCRKPS
jgi:hypothetical protein